MGLWSFLRSLWPWRKRRQPRPVAPAETLADRELGPSEAASGSLLEPAEAPVVAEPPPPPEEAPAATATPLEPTAVEEAAAEETSTEEILGEEILGEAPSGDDDAYVWTVPEGADEDEGWEEEDEDLDVPDPFISGELLEEEPVDVDLEERRAAARAQALEAEQRIYMRTPAGPGSLAEALNQLMTEGLVQAEFVEDGDDEPHILYRPVK